MFALLAVSLSLLTPANQAHAEQRLLDESLSSPAPSRLLVRGDIVFGILGGLVGSVGTLAFVSAINSNRIDPPPDSVRTPQAVAIGAIPLALAIGGALLGDRGVHDDAAMTGAITGVTFSLASLLVWSLQLAFMDAGRALSRIVC